MASRQKNRYQQWWRFFLLGPVASATGLVLFCSFCLELLLLWKNENKMSKKEETPKDWRRFLTPDISGRISR
jgi:hypothetical protein